MTLTLNTVAYEHIDGGVYKPADAVFGAPSNKLSIKKVTKSRTGVYSVAIVANLQKDVTVDDRTERVNAPITLQIQTPADFSAAELKAGFDILNSLMNKAGFVDDLLLGTIEYSD